MKKQVLALLTLCCCSASMAQQKTRNLSIEIFGAQNTIDIHLRIEINRTEVQHDALPFPCCGSLNSAVIPDVIDKIGITHTGQFTLRTERHRNGTVKTGGFLIFAF